jgi:hypothetical protein
MSTDQQTLLSLERETLPLEEGETMKLGAVLPGKNPIKRIHDL